MENILLLGFVELLLSKRKEKKKHILRSSTIQSDLCLYNRFVYNFSVINIVAFRGNSILRFADVGMHGNRCLKHVWNHTNLIKIRAVLLLD